MIRGCNRDLRHALFPRPARHRGGAKRRSLLVSRKLRLLRAHGLIQKLKGRNVYQAPDPAEPSSWLVRPALNSDPKRCVSFSLRETKAETEY